MYSNETGYPSVTEILSPFIDKEWFTEDSRARGEAVHAACEAHLKCLYVPPLHPEHQAYFDSFKRWADMAIDEVVSTEERLVDKDIGYCGKYDIVAYLKMEKAPSLIDIKTSQAFYNWFPIQLSAYANLLIVAKDTYVKRRFSVLTKNDGSGCKVKEYDTTKRLQHFNVFKNALNCHKYFRG